VTEAEGEGDPFLGAKVPQPVPTEEAFHRQCHYEVLPEGRDDLQERLPAALQIPVKNYLAFLVDHAEAHRAGVQIDATVVPMWLGVESFRGLLVEGCCLLNSIPMGCAGKGPRISFQRMQATDRFAATPDRERVRQEST
jgi:hypothetical protein